MKSITTLLTLFLVCATTSYLPTATSDFVLDTDGEPIVNGGTYYVLPVIRGKGGGIKFAATGTETCPLTVVQSPSEVSKGLPLIISSPFKILNIPEGLGLKISFTHVPPCAPTPSRWTVILKGLPEELHVKLTGYENTIDGSFKIQRASPSLEFIYYKFVFCTTNDDDSCGDVAPLVDRKGNWNLMVTHQNNPLLVQFQKVHQLESSL